MMILFPAVLHLIPASSASEPDGTRVYRGITSDRTGEVACVYERWVDGSRAVHRTTTPDGELLVWQEAEVREGVLVHATELHARSGARGELRVGPEVRFDWLVDGRRSSRTERLDHPVVTGPTLYPFVVDRWEVLMAGEPLRVRFAAVEQGRSYGFTLRAASDGDETVVRMIPRSLMVRLVLGTSRIIFDTATRLPLRYDGAVPPRHPETGRRFRASVTYTHDPATP